MHRARSLFTLSVFLFAAAARAELNLGKDAPRLPRFGAQVGVGFPDGPNVGFLYRPIALVRLEAGLSYLTGPGIHLGATLVPFTFPITPTLTLEGSRFFPAGKNGPFQQQLAMLPAAAAAAASSLDLFTVNAHLGLEVGSARRFMFYLHGGISYLQLSVSGFQAVLQSSANDRSLEADNPTIRAIIPSVKLGFLIFFG